MCEGTHAFMHALCMYVYIYVYVCTYLRIWNVWGRKMRTEFWWVNVRKKNTIWSLVCIGQDNIKIQLQQIRWRENTRFICLIWRSGGRSLSVWLYYSCSIKYREFIARNFKPLRKDSAPRSYVLVRTVRTYAYMYLRMYVCMYASMYVRLYIYVCTCIHICTYIRR